MATLIKKFSLVQYIGSTPLTLANLPSGVKSAIRRITQPNAGGTAYASFNPASGVNALTTAAAPTATAVQVFIIETVSASPSVNLGPDWSFAPNKLLLTLGINQTAATNTITLGAEDAGSYVIESSTGLSGLSYTKNGVPQTALSTTVAVALAADDIFGFTATTGSVPGTLILNRQ